MYRKDSGPDRLQHAGYCKFLKDCNIQVSSEILSACYSPRLLQVDMTAHSYFLSKIGDLNDFYLQQVVVQNSTDNVCDDFL